MHRRFPSTQVLALSKLQPNLPVHFHPTHRSLRAGEEMRSLRSLLGSASPGGLQPKFDGVHDGDATELAEGAAQTKEKSSGDNTMTKKVTDSGFETSPKRKEIADDFITAAVE